VHALRSLRSFTIVFPRNPVPPVMRTWPRDLVTSWGGAAIVGLVCLSCAVEIWPRELSIVNNKKKIENNNLVLGQRLMCIRAAQGQPRGISGRAPPLILESNHLLGDLAPQRYTITCTRYETELSCYIPTLPFMHKSHSYDLDFGETQSIY
jgi:hypothetical protein